MTNTPPLFPEILIVLLKFSMVLLMYQNLMAYLDEADLYKFRLVISMARNTRPHLRGLFVTDKLCLQILINKLSLQVLKFLYLYQNHLAYLDKWTNINFSW